jgi:L-histidine N-alpha-methyltransferase
MKVKEQNEACDTFSEMEGNGSIQQFAADVRAGLSSSPKYLQCVYLYDEIGSRIFEQICRLPEYYCTRAEKEILQKHVRDIAAHSSNPVQIVELGSGNSAKTRILLKAFIEARMQTCYVPIDVSQEILTESAKELRRKFPSISVKPIAARYEDALGVLNSTDGSILLVWLGSSIGNYDRGKAKKFLSELHKGLSQGDSLLLGVDLIKDRATLEAAYNDRLGVTAEFNLNLLARINRELGGTFDLDRFSHKAVFNAAEGRIEMYLLSCEKQEVKIEALDMKVSFEEGESIHTESSYKYHPEEIASLAESIGGKLVYQWFDANRRFSLNLFEVDSKIA